MDSSDSDYILNDETFEDKEKEILKYYFFRGFTYEEILMFLTHRHQCTISYSTLICRLKKYGLTRRGVTNKDLFENTFLHVQRRFTEHAIELEGICMPRVNCSRFVKGNGSGRNRTSEMPSLKKKGLS